MWDAQRTVVGQPRNTSPVASRLETTAAGVDLILEPSMEYLTAPSTEYPVTIDPDFTELQMDYGSLKTTLVRDGDSVPRYNGYYLSVGRDLGTGTATRSFLQWDISPVKGYHVLDATMNLYQVYAPQCEDRWTSVRPVSAAWNAATTVWSNQPFVDTSSPNWYNDGDFNDGAALCPAKSQRIGMTKVVTGWVEGSKDPQTQEYDVPTQARLDNYGVRLTALGGNELSADYAKVFCSRNVNLDPNAQYCNDVSLVPTLTVTYEISDLGQQPWMSMSSRRLNDRSQLMVNNGNGNLVVQANDLRIAGRGLDLNVTRFYNSGDIYGGMLGTGWRMSIGPDVALRDWADDELSLQAPGGTWFSPFARSTTNAQQFDEPPGLKKTNLVDNLDGTYTLTFEEAHEKNVFDSLGCTQDHCNYYLKKDIDHRQSGVSNTITYNYDEQDSLTDSCYQTPANQTDPEIQDFHLLTSLTDTRGRMVTFCYEADGDLRRLVEMRDNSGRIWQYDYDSNDNLQYYTDPDGGVTEYTYFAGTSERPSVLASIKNPAQANGARPFTKFSYDADEKVFRTFYQKTSGTSDSNFFIFEWDYTNTITSDCAAKTKSVTKLMNRSDPQGDPTGNANATTYCLDKKGKALTIIDGEGNQTGLSYDPLNLGVESAQSSTNQGGTEDTGTTVYKYDASSRVEEVTAPKQSNNGADKAATSFFAYDTSTTIAGGKFLPSSVMDSSRNCTAFGYNANGDLTDTYAGNTPNAERKCGQTGKNFHTEYRSDGTIDWTREPRGDIGGTTSDYITNYNYDTLGQLTQLIRPNGSCASTTRKLCTTYTYDSLSRVSTVTDGNGATTRYTYDTLDRVLEVIYGGATTCNTGHTNCFTYTYDHEGNLASRTDRANRTDTFTYDRLNRLATQTLANGPTITQTHDGYGNLTSYRHSTDSGPITYSYDSANRLTAVVDPTGTYNYTYPQGSSRDQTITYPNGVAVKYHRDAGRITEITVTGAGSGVPTKYSYSYNKPLVIGTITIQLETNQVQSQTVTNGSPSTTTYAYNADGRLTGADTPGTDYSYSYDNNGNLTKNQGANTTHYAYNQSDQVCWFGSSNNGGTLTANNCTDLTKPAANTNYTYDNAGNGTGTATASITYNNGNQATSIAPTGGGTAVAMSYRDQGNDLRASAGNVALSAGPMDVMDRTTGSGTTFYTRDPFGRILGQHGAAGTHYYLTDRQGTVTTLMGTSGAKTGSYDYDPYGALTNGGSLTTASQNNPWRYLGGYHDIEGDGYYHFGARYYDPGSARFTQLDSVIGNVAIPRSVNPYMYAGGDPVNATDLSGRDWISDAWSTFEDHWTFIEPITLGIGLGAGAIAAGIAAGGAAAAALGIFAGVAILAATGYLAYVYTTEVIME